VYDAPSRTQLDDAIPVGGRGAGAAIWPDGLEAAMSTGQGIVVATSTPNACAMAGRHLSRAEWDQHTLAP
jgi:hypothetical protein